MAVDPAGIAVPTAPAIATPFLFHWKENGWVPLHEAMTIVTDGPTTVLAVEAQPDEGKERNADATASRNRNLIDFMGYFNVTI